MSTLQSVLRIPPDVLFRELGGEAVLLNLKTGKHFGLNESGARMWALLAEHGKIEPAYQALLPEYAVSAEQLLQDLLQLVDLLAAQDLVCVDPA